MKTSGYAWWTAALVLALTAGGGLGMTRTVKAGQTPGSYLLSIPIDCVNIPGNPGMPGRNGLGVLSIPVPQAARDFIDEDCNGSVHAAVLQPSIKRCAGVGTYHPLYYLITDHWYVADLQFGETWQATFLPPVSDFVGVDLALADSTFNQDIRTVGGSILLTCAEQ